MVVLFVQNFVYSNSTFSCRMNPESGVALENQGGLVEITTSVDGLALNMDKENNKVVDVLDVNVVSEDMLNAEERNTTEVAIEASTTIPISSNSSEVQAFL